MRIVVLVKQVPGTITGLSFAADLTLARTGRPGTLGEADELAVDQALRIARRRRDVEVVAVTMGPAGAVDGLRRALRLGADEGVHVLDDRLHGSDALATSRVLAAVIDRIGFDLVLAGCASADSGTAAVPAMVAERLGVAALCFADALTVRRTRVEIRRDDGAGLEAYAAALPAVVSVTERCGQPGYRPFGAFVEARHKLVRTWSLEELGIDRNTVGPAAAATAVRSVKPQVNARERVIVAADPCGAAVRMANFLAERQFL